MRDPSRHALLTGLEVVGTSCPREGCRRGRGRRCAVAGERLPSAGMKKLLVLAVLVALGVVAAKRLRAA